MILYQEIDIVETIHQTVLLIAVDIEMFALARSLVGDCLMRQLFSSLFLWISAKNELITTRNP